jgi:SAM-dependent methyltransferase
MLTEGVVVPDAEIDRFYLHVPRDNPHHIARTSIARALTDAAPSASGTLIDIGCGLRPYRSLFAPYVERYIGIDYPTAHGTPRYVDAAIYGNALRLPLRDGCADTVLCTQVLEHVQEPAVLLSEARRVLRPDGALILTAPLTWAEHGAPHDFYRYTRYGLHHLLQRAGFRQHTLIPMDGLYATLAQVWLDELNFGRAGAPMWQRRLLGGINRATNAVALMLDRRFPSTRVHLTYLVIAHAGCTAQNNDAVAVSF